MQVNTVSMPICGGSGDIGRAADDPVCTVKYSASKYLV